MQTFQSPYQLGFSGSDVHLDYVPNDLTKISILVSTWVLLTKLPGQLSEAFDFILTYVKQIDQVSCMLWHCVTWPLKVSSQFFRVEQLGLSTPVCPCEANAQSKTLFP